MIYLYGVSEPGRRFPAVRGIEGTAVEAIEIGELSALCSVHKESALPRDIEACWAHEHVVEAVMTEAAVLPARFGTIFEDRSSLTAALNQAGESLARDLRRVRGRVELAVRVTRQEPTEVAVPLDGRGYLERKLAARRLRESTIRETLADLGGLAERSKPAAAGEDRADVCVSYLLPMRDVPRFSARIAAIQQANPQLVVTCTGPWAPYSFVSGEPA